MKNLQECTMQELVVLFINFQQAVGEIERAKAYYNGLVKSRQKFEESLVKYLNTEVHGDAIEKSHKCVRTRYAYLVLRENKADQNQRKLIKQAQNKYGEILNDFYLCNGNLLWAFIDILKSGKAENYEDALYIFKKPKQH